MKKTFLKSMLLVFLALTMVALSACNTGGGNGGDTTTTAPVTTTTPGGETPSRPVTGYTPDIGSFTLSALDLTGYKIVYPETASAEVKEMAAELAAAIEEATGILLPVTTDFLGVNEPLPTDPKEIRVGITNRDTGYDYLRGNDYRIEAVGASLVIAAKTEETLEKALGAYTELMLGTDGAKVPDKAYWFQAYYPVENLSLGGVDISKFSIVRDVENQAVAVYLQEAIADMTGHILDIRTDKQSEVTYEILIGNILRGGYTFPAGGKYLQKQVGTKVVLGGTARYAGYYAAMDFIANVLVHDGDKLNQSLALTVATKEASHSLGGLFKLNLPDVFPSLEDKITSLAYNTETVLERFLAAKEELPTEVTVLERFDISDYPFVLHNELYVSPEGSDENPGTKERPLATLARAVDRMTTRGGGVIWMMGGKYSIEDTVRISSAHSGAVNCPLFIKAYEGEEVVLTSNKTLDTSAGKWHYMDPYADPVLTDAYDRLPLESRDFIMYTTLADQGWSAEDMPTITKENGPPSMYVGGKEYTLARFPNDTTEPRDLLYFTYVYDSGRCTVRDGSDLYWTWITRCTNSGWDPMKEVGWEIRVIDQAQHDKDQKGYEHAEYGEEITSWVNTGDIWFYGSTFEGWEFGYYQIALQTEGQYWAHTGEDKNGDGLYDDWTPGNGTPYLGEPKKKVNAGANPWGTNGYAGQAGYSLKSVQPNAWGTKVSGNGQAGRNTYYLFNAIEALDVPGEWFYDKETGYIYMYPTEEHFNLAKSGAEIAAAKPFDLLALSVADNVIIDGITFDGSSNRGVFMESCDSVIFQDCTFRNTKSSNLVMNMTTNCALIYCDFSAGYDFLVKISHSQSNMKLQPTNTVIQNCFFHDPMPLRQVAIEWEACRVIISHNYFNNMTTEGDLSTECILEYNRFEGGSKDVTDGGMIYASGAGTRNNHYRYNLFHMFNATHQAVYNDTMANSNYMYNNVISTLGANSDHCKSWYSSSGWGNVCYGNIQIFRDPLQVKAAGSGAGAEGDIAELATGDKGDYLGESHLFYYYFSDNNSAADKRAYLPVDYDGNPQLNVLADGTLQPQYVDTNGDGKIDSKDKATNQLSQSLAGHWWYGYEQGEVNRYLSSADTEVWEARDPAYINLLRVNKMLVEVYDAIAAKTTDYHVKYFYMPWYLTGKTYTFENVPAGVVVTIPTYQYLEPIAGSTDKVNVVTVPERIFTTTGESFSLTYEELASIERIYRAPAYSVVMNNISLGGTPIYETVDGKLVMTDVADRAAMFWDQGESNKGYVATTSHAYNFVSFVYDDIIPGATENFNSTDVNDYTITPEGWAAIEAARLENPDHAPEESAMEELRFTNEVWKKAGFTFDFDYHAWYGSVYPERAGS